MAFVAALWLRRETARVASWLLKLDPRPVLFGAALAALAACSELAGSNDVAAPGVAPPYVALAARHLQATLKDRTPYDGFAIAPPRWVHAIRGWSWLTCVHFNDRGHPRSYAIFIADDAVVDARYAVETDACDAQTFTPFDLTTGQLGRPTPPAQPPLY